MTREQRSFNKKKAMSRRHIPKYNYKFEQEHRRKQTQNTVLLKSIHNGKDIINVKDCEPIKPYGFINQSSPKHSRSRERLPKVVYTVIN